MRLSAYKQSLSLLLLVVLTSCQPTIQTVDPVEDAASNETQDKVEQPDIAADNTKAPSEGSDSSAADSLKKEPIFPALQPGEYCYVVDTDTKTVQARLTIDAADRVIGDVQGVIHNEQEGYYTSYQQAVDGLIDGSNLNVDVATWIEYDQQNEQATWKISERSLDIKNDTLTKENCDVVSKAFQNEAGLEASDLTSSANRVKTEQVYFSGGKSSTTVSNSVVRGDRDVYILTALGGQQMSLAISATDGSAVFDVVTPSGIILGTELTEEKLPLPHTGDYQIIAKSMRGDATYELDIAIE
ncbi:MAG: hypothetical protein ACFB16_14795 [Phormidesmis sp.]